MSKKAKGHSDYEWEAGWAADALGKRRRSLVKMKLTSRAM